MRTERIERSRAGRSRFAFRHFPLEQVHPHALAAAQAAECARDRNDVAIQARAARGARLHAGDGLADAGAGRPAGTGHPGYGYRIQPDKRAGFVEGEAVHTSRWLPDRKS